MAEQELKACPFCGCKIIHFYEHGPRHSCNDCIADGPQELPGTPTWNDRPLESALTTRLASAEAEVERLRGLAVRAHKVLTKHARPALLPDDNPEYCRVIAALDKAIEPTARWQQGGQA